MTDPGSFTIEAQEQVTELDAIIITHEHQDHYHADSVKVLLEKNPGAVIVTNAAVGKLLADLGITHTQVGDGEMAEVKGIKIEGYGTEHAPIYGDMGKVENTGYFIADRFYFPGDNFHTPGKAVDVLALPVAGPWMKISEAIDFAKEVKARTAFGAHDGMIVPGFRGFTAMVMKMFVPDTEYVVLADGESKDF